MDEPASGYLWNSAIRKRLTLRNYGEFAEPLPRNSQNEPVRYHALKAALLPMQIADGPLAGAWPSGQDKFGHAGGSIYTTTLALLSLQVYYRYPAW